jgi:hypothetical protein
MKVMIGEPRLARLRLPHQRGYLQGRTLKNLRIAMILRRCTTNSSVKRMLIVVQSHCYINYFHASCSFCFFFLSV